MRQIEVENFFKVLGLSDEEQVEGPGPGEVGDDDGVDGHGGEDAPPGGCKDGRLFLRVAGADALLYVVLFARGDVGVLGGLLKSQPQPEHVPDDTTNPVEVVRSIPAYLKDIKY